MVGKTIDSAPRTPALSLGEDSFQTWLGELDVELKQTADNRGTAPLNAAFAVATMHSLRAPEFRSVVRDFYWTNPERTAPESYRMLRTAAGAQLFNRPDCTYPHDYRTPRDYLGGLAWIYRTFPYAQRYYRSLMGWDLNTPISQRYVVSRFLEPVIRHHLPGDEPRRADVGCSDNSGNKRVFFSDTKPLFAFEEVEIADPDPVAAAEKGRLFNAITHRPEFIGRVVGIDKVDFTDEARQLWLAASLTPDEIERGDLPTLHDALVRAEIEPDQLSFRRLDMAQAREVDALVEAEGSPFDAVSAIASWYQGSAAQRKRKYIYMIKKLLRPEGLAYILDFVRVNNNSSNAYLVPLRRWDRMNLTVYHQGRLHDVASFTSGRAKKIRFHQGLGELARGGAYEEDVDVLLA